MSDSERTSIPHGTRSREQPSGEISLTSDSGITQSVTILDMARIVLRSWWLTLLCVSVGLVLSLVWARATTPVYTASMVVAATDSQTDFLSSGRFNFGSSRIGLGLGLGGEEQVTPFQRFIVTLTSITVAGQLEARHSVLHEIYKDAWNKKSNRWERPRALGTSLIHALGRAAGLKGWRSPSVQTLADHLVEEITVSRVGDSGMKRVSYSHPDPEFASKLLAWLHNEADKVVRREMEERAAGQIKYLQTKLESVTVADHRKALIDLLAQQERKMMMIQVDLPLTAQLVEPPVAPEAPSWPRPFLMVGLGGVAGLLTGLFLSFGREGLRRKRGLRRQHGPAQPLPIGDV